jgi:hypothetical protein
MKRRKSKPGSYAEWKALKVRLNRQNSRRFNKVKWRLEIERRFREANRLPQSISEILI